MLSEKATRILSALVHNQKNPLTAKRLADLSGMSERSVSSYIKEVSRFCEEYSIEFISKPGTGIYLNVSEDVMPEILKYIKCEKPYFSSAYRRWYIINVLLNNWTTYTLALFADDLNVSKATVKEDLRFATDWLNNFGVEVVSRPGSGIALEGNELYIRGALVVSNREYQPFKPAAADEGSSDYRLDPETKMRLISTYRSTKLDTYIKGIQDFEKNNEVTLTDNSFFMVLEHMLIQSRRCRSENYVNIPDALTGNTEHRAAQSIIELLLAKKMLPANENEHKYIALLLKGAETATENGMSEISTGIIDFSEEIIQYVSDLTDMRFIEDDALKKRIKRFLAFSIIRVRFGFQLPNPLLTQTKQAYPSVFSACYATGRIYEKAIGIYPSENELSHLALLFGNSVQKSYKRVRAVMVSAAGMGAAQLIEMRLTEELSSLEIVAILSFGEIDKIESFSPQLIITTIKSFTHSIRTVYISSVTGAGDIICLRRACNAVAAEYFQLGKHMTLTQLLKPELILLHQHLPNMEKVLRVASDKLMSGGYVDDQFYANAMEREQIASTSIGKGIAIPHSPSYAVKHPAVCMIILDRSIDWGGEAVDIIFTLALDFTDAKSTSAFFKAFYNIVNDVETITSLRQARDVEDVQKIIADRCG